VKKKDATYVASLSVDFAFAALGGFAEAADRKAGQAQAQEGHGGRFRNDRAQLGRDACVHASALSGRFGAAEVVANRGAAVAREAQQVERVENAVVHEVRGGVSAVGHRDDVAVQDGIAGIVRGIGDEEGEVVRASGEVMLSVTLSSTPSIPEELNVLPFR